MIKFVTFFYLKAYRNFLLGPFVNLGMKLIGQATNLMSISSGLALQLSQKRNFP